MTDTAEMIFSIPDAVMTGAQARIVLSTEKRSFQWPTMALCGMSTAEGGTAVHPV